MIDIGLKFRGLRAYLFWIMHPTICIVVGCVIQKRSMCSMGLADQMSLKLDLLQQKGRHIMPRPLTCLWRGNWKSYFSTLVIMGQLLLPISIFLQVRQSIWRETLVMSVKQNSRPNMQRSTCVDNTLLMKNNIAGRSYSWPQSN